MGRHRRSSINPPKRVSRVSFENPNPKDVTERKLLSKYITNPDIPDWFRGKSWYQIDAANRLQNAIRDDAQQGSIFRVRGILLAIGVNPIVSDKKLKKVMQWSYGNDLAFLWFLMEAYYKTPGKSYSVNEQLILSSIAHLDMVTTLRELDRVLPPGNPSKKNIAKRQRFLEKKRQHEMEVRERLRLGPQHPLPYFNKQIRVYPEHKSLRSVKPDIKVGTDMYEVYKDPTYEVRNEATRWYTTYKLSDANRLAASLIRKELELLFGNMETLAQRDMAGHLIDYELKHIFKENEDLIEEPTNVMCATHLRESKSVNIDKDKKLVEKRDICLKCINVTEKKQKKRVKRLMDELDKGVAKYQSESQKRVPRKHEENKTNVLVFNKDEICECQISEPDDKAGSCQRSFDCIPPPPKMAEEEEEEGKENKADDPIRESQSPRLQGGAEEEEGEEKENMSVNSIRESQSPRLRGGAEKKEEEGTENSESSRLQGGKDPEEVLLHRYLSYIHKISEHLQASEHTPPSSKMYFEAPTNHKPYHFNYHKIFTFRDKEDPKNKIREACVKALDADLKTAKCKHEVELDLQHTAKECAEKTWTKGVEDWNDNKSTSSADSERDQACPKRPVIKGIPQLDYYDCEDKELMATMLKSALHIIAKDPKFVLAAIEDADKLPILREWIYRRYGKTYTAHDWKKVGDLSMTIFKALNSVEFRVHVPKPEILGPKLNVTYPCREYVMRKAAYHKQKFYDKYNNQIMHLARDYWFAMFPRMCSHNPPKSIFFSYMPSRVVDIHHFRPWLPMEYLPAKQEWDKRMEKEKAKLFA